MPTKAPETLYSPDFTKNQLKPIFDMVEPLLKEVLQHGLVLFGKCSGLELGDENLPIIFVYRHLLEMLDSVIVQILECAPGPAALQLRAMFEALLTVEYITCDKGKSHSRAMAYLHEMELKRRRFYMSQDPNTAEGMAYQKFIADDPYAKEWKGLDPKDIASRVAEIDKMLELPELQSIAVEYKRLKKKSDPHWYSLFDGPRNIAELAKLLKKAAAYRTLYGEWSERTHSSDSIDRILMHDEKGKPYARSLRDVSEFNTAIDFAISFTVDASRLIVKHYFPDEEPAFAAWLGNEVLPIWRKIPKITINNSFD